MSLLSPPLQAFMSVVRSGTVYGAADDLGLTQTGVTQRIRSLESELATTLFIRSRKGMKLTEEGEALLRYCRGVEDLEGEALLQIKGAAKDRPIHITLAGPTSVMTARITPLCASLYFAWPKLQLHLLISDSKDRLSMVRSGAATLAIVSPEQVPNEMQSKSLKPDKYILVAASSWKGRRLQDILENERLIDFDENDPTSLNYLKKFGLGSHLKRPRLFVNHNASIIQLFSHGVGFGTLTQEIAKPFLESGELTALNGGAVVEDPLALVWYPRTETPPYFKALLSAIK